MNPALCGVFVVLIFIVLAHRRRFILQHIIHGRKRKDRKNMKELVSRFIGKKCVFGVMEESFGSVVTVKEVSDNGVLVEEKDGRLRIINLDFVRYIEEIKEKKKK